MPESEQRPLIVWLAQSVRILLGAGALWLLQEAFGVAVDEEDAS